MSTRALLLILSVGLVSMTVAAPTGAAESCYPWEGIPEDPYSECTDCPPPGMLLGPEMTPIEWVQECYL